MEIFKTMVDFTDLTNKQIFRTDDLYFGADEERAKELSGKENKRKTAVIKKLTKAELISLAEKHDIEIDKKAKAEELHVIVAEQLEGGSND